MSDLKPTFEIPMSEMVQLRNTFNTYLEHNKRDRRFIVNSKAADWAFKSIGATEKAMIDRLAYELGQTASTKGGKRLYGRIHATTKTTTRVDKKTGKTITKTTQKLDAWVVDTLAARIINSRRIKNGEKPLNNKDLQSEVKKLINARIKSVGFIKSGWLAAAKSMQMKSPDKIANSSFDRATQVRGRFKGDAKSANLSEEPSAMIINSATKNEPGAAAVAQKGAQGGLRLMMADMEKYIERKMQETIDKRLHNARMANANIIDV